MHSGLARACCAAALAALAATGGCATIGAELGTGRPDVVGPDGIEGWRSAHALFWLVPAEGGVVLVDAGMDATGADVRRAVQARRVLAVLITHGHIDHWSGAHTLDVPAYIGRADVALLEGTGKSRALIPRIGELNVARAPLPARLIPVDDGAVVDVGGLRFLAVSMPGHTAGSTAWLVKDLAFTGDAVLADGDGGIDVASSILTDDVGRARASLHRLWPRSFAFILDGHGGVTEDARVALRRRLAAQRAEGL